MLFRSHRLSTVRNATRILVFEEGRIVENGTFDELIARGGTFAALAKAQFLTAGSAVPGVPAPVEKPLQPEVPTAAIPTEFPPVAKVEPPTNRMTKDAAE